MKKVIKLLIVIVIIYLIISAVYVLFHIDFGEKPEIVGMGFSASNNMLRLFMGLPKTHTTYEGVSPIFLIEVIIKVVLAVFLIRFLKKESK